MQPQTSTTAKDPGDTSGVPDRPNSGATRRLWGFAIALPLLLLLPFIDKPIHIDDTAYFAIAKHIVQHPLDYYGLSLNWDGVESPVYEWHASPPLANYYLALVGAMFGWKEWVLHTGFLLPAILASIGTAWLASRLCGRPAVALAASVCTPAFVVSASTLMLDTWLLAFFLLSIASWVEGLQREQFRWLLLSAVFAGLAAWTKYFGVVLVPLLATYTYLKPRRPRFWLTALLIPIAMVALEQTYCYLHFGRIMIVNVSNVLTDTRPDRPLWLWPIIAFSFCGGCTFSVVQLGAVLWNRRLRFAGALIVAALSLLLYALNARGARVQTLGFDLPAVSLIFYVIFTLGGTQPLSLAYTDVRHRRDPESWLLTLWVIGTLVFATCVTWSVNARSVLPLVPAVAILAMRRLDYLEIADAKKVNRRIIVTLAIAALISLAVARVDSEWARSAKSAAAKYAQLAKTHPGAVYFQGHWGFQHYMTEAGVRPFDFNTTQLQPGDIVICPKNNANVRPMPGDFVAQQFVDTFPVDHRMATMSVDLGAGFYSDLWGPLPFALGLKMPPDKYYVYLIAKPGNPFANDTR